MVHVPLTSQPYNSVLECVHIHVYKHMTGDWLILFRSAFKYTYPVSRNIDNAVFPYKMDPPIQSVLGLVP
jgi:hypothetical protein